MDREHSLNYFPGLSRALIFGWKTARLLLIFQKAQEPRPTDTISIKSDKLHYSHELNTITIKSLTWKIE